MFEVVVQTLDLVGPLRLFENFTDVQTAATSF
jgi:hypothetical protein